jgi:tetratricopeptide (TPR) repeat protein
VIKQILFFFLIFVLIAEVGAQATQRKPEQSPSNISAAQAEVAFLDGMRYYILEDYGKAVSYFEHSCELNPRQSEFHFKAAEALARRQRPEDFKLAASHIEQAIRLDSKNKTYYLLAADIYAAIPDVNAAIRTLEKLGVEIPEATEAFYELAGFYQLAGKPEDALKTLEKAEAVFGMNETIGLTKINLLNESGKKEAAERIARKLISEFPDEPRYLAALTSVLNQSGKNKEAIELLEAYISTHSNSGYEKLMLIELYFKNNQSVLAREKTLVAIDDPEIEVENKIVLLKNLESQTSSNPDAMEDLLKALERLKKQEAGVPEVWLAGGDIYFSLKLMREARDHYSKAIQLGTTAYQAWSNLAILDAQLNMNDSLISDTEKGFELYPNSAELWYFNGYGWFQKKKYADACNSLEQAKGMATDKNLITEINRLLGEGYQSTGKFEQSEKCFEAVLAEDAHHEQVLNNYSFYLSIRGHKLDLAEELSERLIRLFPENNTYLDTYAWVLFARGKFREAKKVMDKVIGSGGANAVHLEHYGDILFKLNETDLAIKQWELALSMNSRNDLLRKKILNRKLN